MDIRFGEGVGSTDNRSLGYAREKVLGNEGVLHAIDEVGIGKNQLGDFGVVDIGGRVDDHLLESETSRLAL